LPPYLVLLGVNVNLEKSPFIDVFGVTDVIDVTDLVDFTDFTDLVDFTDLIDGDGELCEFCELG